MLTISDRHDHRANVKSGRDGLDQTPQSIRYIDQGWITPSYATCVVRIRGK